MPRRQIYALVVVAFDELIDGYDLIVMSVTLILLRAQFGLTPSQIGLLGGVSFIGAAIGMFGFGDVSDRLGRCAIFVANLIFLGVFSVISASIVTLPQLFVARFTVGIGVGMDLNGLQSWRHHHASDAVCYLAWPFGARSSSLIALPLIHSTGDNAWR